MKKLKFSVLIFAALILTAFSIVVKAQDEAATNEAPQQNINQTRRPNLLAELNLTPQQIQQIRRINRDNQPLRREAQQRLREANRNLDAAIYADDADETEIQTRLKEVQLAQAEVVKLRSTTEFAVRKILTPEQLVKFREVRQRFMERMENVPKQQNNRPLNAPNRRLLNRQRKMRQNN